MTNPRIALSIVTWVVSAAHAAWTDLLVSAENKNAVKRYDQNGVFVEDFVAQGAGGLVQPEGLGYAPDGNLYVSSSGNDRILRFHGLTGEFLGMVAEAGGLDRPWDLTVGPDGLLYVSSSLTHEVRKYDPITGAFMGIAAAGGGLSVPDGLTFGPDGMLYVCGTSSGKVHRFDPATGAPLGDFAVDHLTRPNDIVFGSDGLAYILDNSGAIVRYSGAGDFVDIWRTGAGSPGLVWGEDGYLYASDYGGRAVRRFGGPDEGVFIPAISLPTNMVFMIPAPGGAAALACGAFFATRRRRTGDSIQRSR